MTIETEKPVHLRLCEGNGQKRRRAGMEADSAGTVPAHVTRDRFLELLLPVKAQLYNFIRKAANFSPDADDVFQDTLLKGFRYFHSFDSSRSFKTWIFKVAHNMLKDAFRSRQYMADLDEVGDVPAEMNQSEPDVKDIYAAAANLKPRHREVFFLYYYNEFSVAEIGNITGLSRPNVKFVLHQARKQIKKTMEVPQ